MIHIVPHCAMYTGSTTRGVSFTNVTAPVTWYRQGTERTCSHGIGMFSKSLNTAWGTNFSAPRYTRLSCRNFRDVMSPWSRMIFRRCSGGISSFCASTYPNFRLSPNRFALSCAHFRAWPRRQPNAVSASTLGG